MTATSKSDLRDAIKSTLARISTTDRAHQGHRLCERIAGSAFFHSSSTFLAYASMPTEISLDALIRQALEDGRAVCMPRVDWETSTMKSVRIRNLDEDLQIGRYGLRFPRSYCQTVPDHEIPLALIPGLGFDASGRRLGRGGGFYDRWIESRRLLAEPVMMVGVGFDEQIVACVPADAHDQRMDRVVTPTTHYESTHG